MDIDMDKIRPEIRTFTLGAVALSTAAWNIAFNLGAYHTVFYRNILVVWVTVTAIFFVTILLPEQDVPVPLWGKLLMLVPTIGLLLMPISAQSTMGWAVDWLLIGLSVFAFLICLPYAIYVAVNIINADLLALPETRLKVYLLLIVLVVGLIGFWMGANNYRFINCGDFKVAGDDQPANCQPGPPMQF